MSTLTRASKELFSRTVEDGLLGTLNPQTTVDLRLQAERAEQAARGG